MAEITNVLLVGPSGVGKSTLLARAVEPVLASSAPVLGIVRYRDDGHTPFAEQVKRRDDVELIEVSLENRESLVDVLVERFRPRSR